jgi:hypothetical protein
MTIASFSIEIPVNEDSNCSQTNINTNNHVSEEHPATDKLIISISGRFLHNILIGRVESKSGSRGAISNKVNPQELD